MNLLLDKENMAATIPYSEYFGHVNDILDGKLQRGGGRTLASTKQSKTKKLISFYVNHGMKKTHVRRYEKLLDNDFLDFEEKEFAVGLIKNYAETIGFNRSISNTLQNIGFTKNKSIQMENIFEAFINTSYTNSQLIDMCIEQIFQILFNTIADIDAKFYIEPEKENIWFKNNNISMINAPYKANIDEFEKLKETMTHLQIEKEVLNKHNILYHTTTWEYAFHILNKIDHTTGRKCLDFGIKSGFYLGTRLYDTIEWGQRLSKYENKKSEIATIVFLIPKHYPDTIKWKSLTEEEWLRITFQSRKCQAPKFRGELEELENIDLVYGPVVSNSEDIKKNSAKPRKFKDKHQLVSKTDNGDAFLQTKIKGVIFYKKN